MKSPTITMERAQAEQKLAEYETAMRLNPKAINKLDRGVRDGYRILAKGGRLVDVNEAIKHAGLNRAGLPMLAIARAHVERCRWTASSVGRYDAAGKYVVSADGGGRFDYYPGIGTNQEWRARPKYRTDFDRILWTLPAGTFDPEAVRARNVMAFAPLIPLPLRPVDKLENYFLLWEANWHPAPPVDPYLLRPLAGSLMEIVAEWDVTPLELAAVRSSMQAAN